MKKIQSLTIAALTAMTLSSSGFAQENTAAVLKEAMKVDVATACIPGKNSVDQLLKTAKKFNPTAIELGVQFKRLGMTTAQYIDLIEKAIRSKSKTITLLDKNGKPTKNKMDIDSAAERACKFAVRALQQHVEADESYKLAIPGEGYQY